MRFLLFFMTLFMMMRAFADLSPIENQIVAGVRADKKSQLVMLKKLVDINSGSMNPAGVYRVGHLLERELKRLGFSTHWEYEPINMHHAGTLIAKRQGKLGEKILLIGHLDTVFSPQHSFKKFILHKNSAKGPGIIDDKGGLVVLLSALKALQKAHALDQTSITVVLTGDEEDSGKPTSISRAPLINAAKGQAIALDFEPAITLNTATIARRGISNWTITSKGNESHSATIFQPGVGVGAIFELASILTAMRLELAHEKYLAFNPGLIAGGTNVDEDKKLSINKVFGKQNVVAKFAIAKGDIRFIDDVQKKNVEEKITRIVKAHLPHAHSEIAFVDGIPAMSATENNYRLLEKYSKTSLDLNESKVVPLDLGLRGAGDISHVANIVPANLSGLGPTGYGTHSVIESIDLESLPIQTTRAAIFIYRLTHAATNA